MSNKKYSCIMFDLDGTIVDTIESLKEAVNTALREEGYPERSYDEVRLAIGNGAKKLMERSLPSDASNDENIQKLFCGFHAAYRETYLMVDKCYDGIYETVCELKRRGYVLAVLSNKPDDYVKGIIDKLFPSGTFDYVRGQTELPIKPDPTVPRLILEALGCEPFEAIYVGDSDVDIKTGKNAGMKAVGVSWGFRGRELLEREGADFIADRPEELFEMLE